MTALEELIRLSGLPAKAPTDRKVLGFFCSYIPEEIIYAAGMIPVRIRPAGCTETVSADAYMTHLNCTFARSCLEYIGTGRFDFLDGIVFANTCDNIRRLYDILKEKRPYPFMHFISIPHKADGNGPARWFTEELLGFKEHMEKAFGTAVSDDALREAIDVYNETRGLLNGLYDLRRRENPPISGTESLHVLLAATTTPREYYNRLLRELLKELQERPGIRDYRARLMIVGSEYDDPAHTKLIEDLGGLVVTDALCFGSRYFREPVKTEKDVLAGIATSYLNRPSCPRMSDRVIQRADFIKKMADEFHIDGVLFQQIRYCDLWGGEAVYLRKTLRESDIPLLVTEREYWLSGAGQLKTRIQAFLEMIDCQRQST